MLQLGRTMSHLLFDGKRRQGPAHRPLSRNGVKNVIFNLNDEGV